MIFEHPTTDHILEIDPGSGLPVAVGHAVGGAPRVLLRCGIEAVTGGTERRAPTGGLDYADTVVLGAIRRLGDPRVVEGSDARIVEVPVGISREPDASRDGGAERIDGVLRYRFNRYGPGISWALGLDGGQDVVVRTVVLRGEAELATDGPQAVWELRAPGNSVASGVALGELTADVGVSPLGGLRGSSALVHLQPRPSGPSVALWFDNDTEIPELSVSGHGPRTLRWKLDSCFSADLAASDATEIEFLSVDVGCPPWADFPPVFEAWLRGRGLTGPGRPPAWLAPAMIFEAQIGFSVFEQTNRYSPYPEVTDLIADLDRIAGLGFSVVQLMPRQPYPSYNIHDYADIDVAYGPKADIVALVEACHRRGIRIILDVLLHGVLDQESIGTAADGVRSGPFQALIAGGTTDSFSTDVNDWTNYLVAWSRHILDFEPYWKAGSPPVAALIAEHPEWFSRNSAGEITGVYTKAFDARNRSWQRYFTDAMCHLVRELDIDGFRFDAPTYNDFSNWADWARGRAGASALACSGLFERLRPVLRALKPDLLLYTEPSGHVLRRSMDLNYNYDEQWLVTAVAHPGSGQPWRVSDAKGLAAWMRDRDALLPAGSMTAHHIDSHDTFWWPSWGAKWRREQFGFELFRLLTVIFGALPGPFMMFVGGEDGIEDVLPRLARLKAEPTWHGGEATWWCQDTVPDSVFGLTRRNQQESLSVVVNLADGPVRFDGPDTAHGHDGEPEILFSLGRDSIGPMIELGARSAVAYRRRRPPAT